MFIPTKTRITIQIVLLLSIIIGESFLFPYLANSPIDLGIFIAFLSVVVAGGLSIKCINKIRYYINKL